MTFVVSAWYLTIFFFAIAIFFVALSFKWERTNNKSLVQAREILFLIGICYVALAHFSMYVSIGQALDENYQSPCENVVNSSTYINNSYTVYTYVDSCASVVAPEPSTALVVIYTWLIFAGGFGVFLTIMVGLVKFARRFV